MTSLLQKQNCFFIPMNGTSKYTTKNFEIDNNITSLKFNAKTIITSLRQIKKSKKFNLGDIRYQ